MPVAGQLTVVGGGDTLAHMQKAGLNNPDLAIAFSLTGLTIALLMKLLKSIRAFTHFCLTCQPALIWASLVVLVANPASAQSEWRPDKTIEVIVGTSPGGAADNSARLLQKILQQIKVGSAVVVNKPGGSYSSSFAYLNQHPGDGHYICVSPINLVTNRIVGAGGLDHLAITPLAQLISDYHVFSVRADSDIRNGVDLLDRLRRNPASLSIAISPTFGGANHFAAGSIFKAAGIDVKKLRIVAFASGGESTTAVLGGHADVLVSATPSVRPMIEAGRMRALGITSARRAGGVLAQIPTWIEQGANASFSNWRGVIGPRDMTLNQIAFWDAALARLVQNAEWRGDLERNFQESAYLNSRDSGKFLAEQAKEFAALLTELGLAKSTR